MVTDNSTKMREKYVYYLPFHAARKQYLQLICTHEPSQSAVGKINHNFKELMNVQ